MRPLVAKILIVGIPFLLSISWFFWWVIRLSRAARRARGQSSPSSSGKSGSASGGTPPAST